MAEWQMEAHDDGKQRVYLRWDILLARNKKGADMTEIKKGAERWQWQMKWGIAQINKKKHKGNKNIKQIDGTFTHRIFESKDFYLERWDWF